MRSIEEVVAFLVATREAAGSPSYAELARRVAALRAARGADGFEARVSRSTVYDAFDRGRRRLDGPLVADLARALGVPDEEADALLAAIGRLQGSEEAARVASVVVGVPDPGPLVGRATELAVIVDAPDGAVVVVSGLGGMGKSHLAQVAAAKRAAASGAEVLQVDLRGNDPDLPPAAPGAVQTALLRALGRGAVPAEADERTDALARALAERPVIVVLDDAADGEQVRAIVPDHRGPALVVVTARRRLDLDDARELVLEPLDEDAAVELIAAQAPAAIAGDPLAARALVEAVSGIPLALTLTAARVAARPEWTLHDHARQVVDRMAQARLDEPLSAVLSSAYTALPEAEQRALRLLAAQPLGDLATPALAALWDRDPAAATDLLAGLDRAHLVAVRADRVGLHDVVRAFAHDRGLDADPHSARTAAIDRLADHLVEQAWSAHVGLHVAGESCLYGAREADVVPLAEDDARAWLSTHAEQLLTMAASLEGDRPDVVLELSGALTSWLNAAGRHQDGRWLHAHAVAIASRGDDPVALARARLALGHSLTRLGDAEAAARELEAARPVFQRTGETGAERVLLSLLALGEYQAGRYDRAAAWFDEVVLAARASGSAYEETIALGNAGDCWRAAGRPDEAAIRIHEALIIADREDLGMVRAANLINLSQVLVQLERPEEALDRAEAGLEAARAFGDFLVGHAHLARAGALLALGRASEGAQALEEAAAIADTLGDPQLAAEVAALTAS